MALISTPNREFNVLFPNFQGPFRHDDHKFEWDRKEFKNWAEGVIESYPEYQLEITGKKLTKNSSEILLLRGVKFSLQFCSQI